MSLKDSQSVPKTQLWFLLVVLKSGRIHGGSYRLVGEHLPS